MSMAEAEVYHSWQIGVFAAGPADPADLVSAVTINNIDEAVGISRAAKAHAIPAVISFSVEIDGSLSTGDSLGQAINAVDKATNSYPAY